MSARARGGPLAREFPRGSLVCLEVDGRRSVVNGFLPLVNPTGHNIVIERVALADAAGFRLVDAVVVPAGTRNVGGDTARTLVGLQRDWSPSPEAEPAAGFVIPAGTKMTMEGVYYNFVLQLEMTDPTGEARHEGVRIRYQHGRRMYEDAVGVTLQLTAGDCSVARHAGPDRRMPGWIDERHIARRVCI